MMLKTCMQHFKLILLPSIILCLNPLLLTRDGHITPVELRMKAEQQGFRIVAFGPHGAKMRCNQEEEANKVLDEVGSNTHK